MKVLFDISPLGDGFFRERARAGIFHHINGLLNAMIDMADGVIELSGEQSFERFEQSIWCRSVSAKLKDKPFYWGQEDIRRFYEEYVSKYEYASTVKQNVREEIKKQFLKSQFLRRKGIVENYDVFHYHNCKIALPEHQTKSCLEIISVFDMIPVLFPQYFEVGKDGVPPHTKTLLSICGGLKANQFVYTNSFCSKKDILSCFPNINEEQVLVCYPAVSERFQKVEDQEKIGKALERYGLPQKPYILAVNTIEPRKNLRATIYAFWRFLELNDWADVNLVLAGPKGWLFDDLTKHIGDLDPRVKPRVFIPGYIQDADLPAIYSGALMFCYPSFYEGFGLPPLEAMRCGTPVIVSNVASLPEVVGNAGLFVEPSSIEQISDAMCSIYRNHDLKAHLSSAGQKRAATFTWDRAANETISLYKYALAYSKKKANQQSIFYSVPKNQKAIGIEKAGWQRAENGRDPCQFQNAEEIRRIKTVLSSGHLLFREGMIRQALECYRHSALIYEGDGTALSNSLKVILERAEAKNIDFEQGAHEHQLVVLFDTSRLFLGNQYSGISKYVLYLVDVLVKNESITVIPFYNKCARGFRSNDYKDSILTIEAPSGGSIDVLDINEATELAKSLANAAVVYHSPYHPLPEERIPGLAYCLTIHDIFHLTHRDLYSGGRYLTEEIVKSLRPADHILVNSRYTGRSILEFMNIDESICMTHTPLAGGLTAPKVFAANCSKQLLIPFQNDPRKNFPRMLRIAKKWLKKASANTLAIFGNVDALRRIYHEELRDLSDRITLVHNPTDESLATLYSNSFGFLYFSELEGFGMPPLEALSCGCLPLMLDLSCFGEVYSGYPYVLHPGIGDDEVVNILQELSEKSNEERCAIGSKFSSLYSWNLTAATTVAGYLRAIHSASLMSKLHYQRIGQSSHSSGMSAGSLEVKKHCETEELVTTVYAA